MSIRYSHPPEDGHDGVELRVHLDDVARRVRQIVSSDATTAAGESLQRVVETLAYVHDFGKATTYFQQYLGVKSGEPPSKDHRHHAPVGSFVAYYALDAQGFDTETCLAGFVAVAKHHGRLPDVSAYVLRRTSRRKDPTEEGQTDAERQQSVIAKQLRDINLHASEFADDLLDDATHGDGSWHEFASSFGEILNDIASTVSIDDGETLNRESVSDSCYGLVLECWGALVFADKTSAASRSKPQADDSSLYATTVASYETLKEYIEELEASASADPDGSRAERLNHHRSRARLAILENATTFAKGDHGVATLTLPTGMGKTLSGLSAAQTIRDERSSQRVIYALPFTSIIDQVVDDLETIYETNTLGRLLTAHHHLSETVILDEDDIDADEADKHDDVAGMLAEGWRAGLTVTTFVQLFESLAGPANKQSMKLPALRNSVIVLDEPQSLPLDWWKFVPRLVRMLTEQYGATVIAMTATQPKLFEEATELVDDPDVYFGETARVEYELDPSAERYIETQTGPKSYEDAVTTLLESLDADESSLAVCNTIDSARELTTQLTDRRPDITQIGEVYAEEIGSLGEGETVDPETLANLVADAGDRSVLHLSTRIRPVDRLTLVETAKTLTEAGHQLITISTQLIEAGVDISFDRVYRDLAPIDSIVQAAGRCNRSFERDRGTVTVWWLDVPEEQTKTPAEAVYNRGATLLPVAAETLDAVRGDKSTLPERTVARTAVEMYYRKLHCEKDVGKYEYSTYVDDARGDELGQLSLIDQRNAIDICICRTESDREIIDEIKTTGAYEFRRLRELIDELKETQVSVPVYRSDSDEATVIRGLDSVHGDTNLRWLDAREEQMQEYFDPNTGFVVPDSTVERRFL